MTQEYMNAYVTSGYGITFEDDVKKSLQVLQTTVEQFLAQGWRVAGPVTFGVYGESAQHKGRFALIQTLVRETVS